MKLVNTLYNLEFDLMENQILVLSIENHLAYRNILEELWKQYKGETGNFILSDGDKELKMSQRIECIYNIFNINTNDRKIISKLYQELTYQNDALLQEESIRFKQELMEYFDKLISTVPYNLREEGAKEKIDLFPALKEYYTRHMKDGTFVSWLAFDGENIVGTSGMSFVEKPPYFGCPSGKIGLLSSMFTNPDYRRKGIAKELLSRVVNDAREYGCGTVQITASDMGVKLYTDFGFVHNDNFMQYKI